MKYKILICGAGSIGERHIQNLLKIGCSDIIIYRKNNKKLRTIKKNIKQFFSLEKALLQKPNIAIITNPTSQHISTAIKCAKSNCHLFIEKPLSNNFDKINLLKKICLKKNLICTIGFMMRYHPLIKRIKKIIDNGKIGKIIHYRSQWGEDLRLWHPWEDHKLSYAANDRMGGGPTLTLSHDIDLAIWFCNQKLKKKYILFNSISDLDIKTHHGSDILIKFNNNITANLHLDFFQNPPKRTIEIVGTMGRLEFDYYKSNLKHYFPNKKKIENYKIKNFDRNQMFLDEMVDFLRCIKKNLPPPISISEATRSLEVCLVKK